MKIKQSKHTLEVYEPENAYYKEWRWRVKAGNNKIVVASSEGFKTKQGAIRNFVRSRKALSVFL